MSNSGGRKRSFLPSISADFLKNAACVMMILYSVGVIVFERGLLHIDQYSQETLSQMLMENSRLMNYALVGSLLEMMGGAALPLYTFLLVEGFLHTSDYRKYFMRIGIFAVASEIPYDLAMRGKLFDFTSQNALFSTAVALFMLYCLRMAKDMNGFKRILCQVVSVVGALLWSFLLRSEYGLAVVLLVASFYIFYDRTFAKFVVGVIISVLYVTGPFSFLLIWGYSGKRRDRIPKYAYYVFYPLQMLVLWVIMRFVPV